MIAVCLACVVAAVVLAAGPSARRRSTALLSAPGVRAVPPRSVRTLLRWAVRGLVVGCVLVAAALVDLRWGALAVALAVAGTGSAHLVGQWRRRRRVLAARTEVAEACRLLAAELRVGRVPSTALASAAADSAVLRPAARLQDVGGDVCDTWVSQAELPGRAGLAELARAWRVAGAVGAPLAPTLEQVSGALAADHAVRRVVTSELAAPRATGKIMAGLPAVGIGIGYLLGGDPLAFLLAGPMGWGCLVGGTALAVAGVVWIEALARAADERG